MIGKNRIRIHPYFQRSLRADLRKHAATIRATEGAVLESALRQYLGGTNDWTLMLRRLDRLGRAVERLQRDVELQSEAFALWVKLWFAHTPNVPEDAKRAARASAESRFKQYLDHLAEQFGKGKRLIDVLPQESIADDEELLKAATGDEEDTKK